MLQMRTSLVGVSLVSLVSLLGCQETGGGGSEAEAYQTQMLEQVNAARAESRSCGAEAESKRRPGPVSSCFEWLLLAAH